MTWARIVPLVLSLFLMTVSSAASADTGAPAGSDLDKLLQAQKLTVSDLETNRAGKVSEREVDQVNDQRGTLWLIFFTIAGGLLAMSLGFAIYDYTKKHNPMIFIMPGVALLLDVLFYVFFVVRLQIPSVANENVTAVEGPVEGFIGVSGGGYVLHIQGVEYKGVSRQLELADMPKGRLIKAYVVPKTKMVVAIEPR